MPVNPLDSETQRRIRICVSKYLQLNGIEAAELAERMGIKRQSVLNYLSTATLTPRTIQKISEALRYPYELLIRGEEYYGTNRMDDLERRIKAIEDFLWPRDSH